MAMTKPPPRPGVLTKARKAALLGPAIIVGALQFGPGNTVSAAVAGATHGYTIIWLIAASAILMLVYTDMAIRIGLASDKSAVQIIKQTLSRPVGVITGVCVFIIAVLFITGSLLGAALGLKLLFGSSVQLWSVVCAVVAFGFFWARNAYTVLEKAMILAVGVMLIVFVITAITAQPSWLAVGAGFVPGPIPGGGVVAFALLGTNLSIYAAFYAAYTIREKKTRREDYRATTYMDTLPGVIAPGIMTILIIVAASAVMRGRSIESAADIAQVLTPTIGVAASYVFAIGLFAAGFTSVMGNAAAGGSIPADGVGLGSSLQTRPVRVLSTVVLAAGVAIVLIFGAAPVQLIILVNALTLFVFPFLGAMILILANDKSRMGSLRNSVWQNVLGGAAWLLVLLGAIKLAIELVTGS